MGDSLGNPYVAFLCLSSLGFKVCSVAVAVSILRCQGQGE